MKSFLTRIKAKMAENYGGRYLGEVLAEVIREEPTLAPVIWGKTIQEPFYVVTENDYLGSHMRYADLALVSKITDKPLAIAEIKYEDEKSSLSLGQLKDYLKCVENLDVCFTYLTKNLLPPAQSRLLERWNCHLLYSELGQRIEEWAQCPNNSDSPYGKMLINYLRDEGVMWTEVFSEKAVKLLVIKGNRFPTQTGSGRLVSEERMVDHIPSVFAGTMNNMALLGRLIHERIDPEKKIIATTPSIGFAFDPIYSKKKLLKLLRNDEDAGDDFSVVSKDNVVVGGDYWTAARYSVSRNERGGWCYLRVRLIFSFRKGESLMMHIDGGVYSSKFWKVHQEEIPIKLDKKNDFRICQKELIRASIKCISKSIQLQLQEGVPNKELKKSLNVVLRYCNE